MMICPQTQTDPKSVLLVGPAESLTSAGSPLTSETVHVVRLDAVLKAIAALRREHFDRVVVSLSALESRIKPALSGLRQADPAARIILLAEMADEPLIVDLMQQSRPSRRLFDDYLIAPVGLEQVLRSTPAVGRPQPAALAEADKDRRIAELERLVIQDDLTGLKNRRYLRQFLPQVLDLAAAHQLRVTLMLFDIDDFKHYNDAYGHTVGDNVLRQAGRMIQRCCRSHDVVARLGGDEFAVVFWDLPEEKNDLSEHLSRRNRRSAGVDHPREPIFMAERFCKELTEASFDFIGPKGKGALTISGGLATFPADAQTPQDLFEKADKAMLEAKRSGKNRLYLVGRPV